MPVKKNTVNSAAVKEEVKETAEKVSAAAKDVAEKTEKAVKKTAAKAKVAADKTVKKVTKTAKETKAAVEKAMPKDEVVLQISGKEDISLDALVEACKADYKAKGHRMAKNVTVYVKPEEGVAYYTVAGKGAEDFKVNL